MSVRTQFIREHGVAQQRKHTTNVYLGVGDGVVAAVVAGGIEAVVARGVVVARREGT